MARGKRGQIPIFEGIKIGISPYFPLQFLISQDFLNSQAVFNSLYMPPAEALHLAAQFEVAADHLDEIFG